MKTLTALLLFTLSFAAYAANNDIPLTEQAFLDKIPTVDKAVILDQLGEPSRAIDVRSRETGEVVGAIWHYRYLNTSEDGDYYKTTELDFIGDRVVTVVFINTEDEDTAVAATPAELECATTC